MGSLSGALSAYNPPDQNNDWSDDTIYQQLPPWLRQSYLASLSPGSSSNSSPSAFGVNPMPNNPMTRTAPGSFESVQASGPAGLGTNQPQTGEDRDTGGMQGATQLAAQSQAPIQGPPGSQPTPQARQGAMPPPPTSGPMPPPGGDVTVASQPPMPVGPGGAGGTPQGPGLPATQPPPGTSPNLNPAIQRDIDVMNSPMPVKGKSGALGVVQRLGMALLSAGKLAPYAQQIIYPEYTAQMNQRGLAEQELKTLTGAQEAMGRAAQAEAYAVGGRQRPIVGKDGTILVPNGQGGWQVQQPAPDPVARKKQALDFGLDEDTANAYALGLKSDEVSKFAPVQWAGLSPQLQALFKADPSGMARVPVELLKPQESRTAAMTPERIGQFNQLLGARYQQMHPNTPVPAYMQLAPNASLEDYQNVEKAVAGLEGQAGTLANQQASQQLRQQTFALAQMEAQRRAEEAAQKQEQTERTLAEKVYAPVQDSAERFNVMSQNYEDAVNNHDQQAMLSLLYNHMGMTMGLQKGARMTQALIQEAMKSRPWLQGMVSKFDKDGYLTGVTLAPAQMQQMVNNAQGRFNQDSSKAKSSADFIGLKNGGPTRIPNEATKRYYLHISNNDPNKATQMMLTDGWKPQ